MKSNLDLARECFADVRETADGTPVIAFYDAQLDAFADNIRANHLPDDGGMISEAALSHAINQASCSIDDAIETGLIRAVSKAIWRQLQAQQSAQAQPVALPAGMPEPVASVYTMEALVPGGGVRHHVTLHKPLPAGTKLYTAAQVQAMLAAAPQPVTQPSPAAVERKPLTAHFTPFYLLANCRRICSEEHQHTPNWSIATELFAVGSTTAKRICREAGIDPDAFEVRKVGITAQQGGKT